MCLTLVKVWGYVPESLQTFIEGAMRRREINQLSLRKWFEALDFGGGISGYKNFFLRHHTLRYLWVQIKR